MQDWAHPEGSPPKFLFARYYLASSTAKYDLTKDIFQPLFKSEDTTKSSSTERFVCRIEEVNLKILRGYIKPENLMAGSLDVEASYTTLATKRAGNIARDRIFRFE